MYTAIASPTRVGNFFDPAGFDRLLDNLFIGDSLGLRNSMDRIYSTEKKNEDGSVTLTLSTPGAERSDIDVSYEKGILAISYNKPEGSNALVNSFTRRWKIPSHLDADSIAATYSNGILTIVVSPLQTQEVRTRKITVN
jgi:HSP20 family protein